MKRRNPVRKILLLLAVLLPALVLAQADMKKDIWEPFQFFVGEWEGQGEGKSGISKVEKNFRFIMNGQYLHLKTKAVFEPQEKNLKGEVHEDWGFFSYDRSRKRFVFRQFHIEGFINQYVLGSISDDGKTLIFDAEEFENVPPGWKARITYKILDEDTLEESFDLATPGKDLQCYILNTLTRKK
jgi:hypothetical protein